MRSEHGSDAPKYPWLAPLCVALIAPAAWLACLGFGGFFVWLGSTHGCSNMNEGATSTCEIGGVDITPFAIFPLLLAGFGAPLFAIGAVVGLVTAVIMVSRRPRD